MLYEVAYSCVCVCVYVCVYIPCWQCSILISGYLGWVILKLSHLTLHHGKDALFKWVTHDINKVLVAQLCPTLCDPKDCSYQAPLSMEFSRQEYWSGLPFPSPGDLSDPGIEPRSPVL